MKRISYLLLFLFLYVSCEAIFVEDISETSLVLLAPSDNTSISRGSILFSWEEVIDATDYQIQIATPSFDQAQQIVLDSIVATSFFLKDIDSGAYQWRVKAMNSSYVTGYTTQSLTVE